jgi:hypothetical protein
MARSARSRKKKSARAAVAIGARNMVQRVEFCNNRSATGALLACFDEARVDLSRHRRISRILGCTVVTQRRGHRRDADPTIPVIEVDVLGVPLHIGSSPIPGNGCFLSGP